MKEEGWAEALDAARAGTEEKVPKGWLNLDQVKEKYFKSYSAHHVRMLLNANLGATVERKKFKVVYHGCLRLVYHYKLK